MPYDLLDWIVDKCLIRMNGPEAVLTRKNEWARSRFDKKEWMSQRPFWHEWMGQSPFWHKWVGQGPFWQEWKINGPKASMLETTVTWLKLCIWTLNKNVNWAQGRSEYIVLHIVCMFLFDIIHWAIAHAHSCVCRWAKRGPDPAPVKSCGTTEFWRVSPSVSRARLVFAFLLCYVIFVLLARTLHMYVYSFHGLTWFLDDPVCTELMLLYFCCELSMYICLVVWMCHVSTALWTKFWTASVWPLLTLLKCICFGLRP